jgi:hypothetical protein
VGQRAAAAHSTCGKPASDEQPEVEAAHPARPQGSEHTGSSRHSVQPQTNARPRAAEPHHSSSQSSSHGESRGQSHGQSHGSGRGGHH